MKILGLTDEITTCSCCGRTGLKCTVAIETEGEVVYYGRTCATRHTGKSAKAINKEVKNALEERKKAARREFESTPEYVAYEAAIAQENANKTLGAERLARLRVFNDALAARSQEIRAKFQLQYF
jgi:ribosome-binding protein aMBF1 (putative translation factor)